MTHYRLSAAIAVLAVTLTGACARADNATETIVIMRHGEKPAGGYGQLNCQGLNRAMALPRVLGKLFGKPDAIFAPDPSKAVDDPAGRADYVRPLATIEPTAVVFALAVAGLSLIACVRRLGTHQGGRSRAIHPHRQWWRRESRAEVDAFGLRQPVRGETRAVGRRSQGVVCADA
jgi:hypothetical protein